MSLSSILFQVDINEKIENAPNSSYEIGVFIGSLLPFMLLVILAYLAFRYHKNRNKNK